MSKEPTRFKQTEIGELPEEWEVIKVQEACDDISAEVAKVKKRECRSTGKYPVIDQGAEFISGYTDHEGACKDLPVIVFGDHTRIFKFVDFPFVRGADGVKVLRPKPNFHPRFLFYALSSLKIPTIGYQRHYSLLKEQFIPLPPLEEQKRIAGVLRLVDRVAEETRRIVDIYERAKRFALKRLLTRGIGHTRFKQTEIGELPEEWEVLRLEDVSKIETGRRMKGGAQSSGQVLSLGGEHIGEFGNIVLKNPKYISKEFYDKMKKGKLDIGDVIMCKDGAKTGKVGYIKEKYAEFMTVNEHVFIIRSKDSNILINQFLFYVLFSEIGQSQVKSSFHGLIGGITYEDLKSFLIPLPPLEEQKRIAEMLSTIDAAIENERRYLGVLEKCKRWLLDTLLTGKIRLPSKIDDILKEVLTDAS
jgi:type I restriction enzyme S subunit